MKPGRILLLFFILILAALILGPLIIPIPPLTDTVPVDQLTEEDSLFVEINGINVHYKRAGQGEPAILLLHGFGASTFSWREVMQPLGQYGTLIAFDRQGFGLTERLLPGEWTGENPYTLDAQVAATFGLMDALGIERAVLVGHSAGGTVAVAAALRNPQRVLGLVLVDAAIYTSGGAPSWVRPLLNAPQFDRLGPWFVRSLAGEQGTAFLQTAWHDPAKITPAVMAGYRKPLRMENWDAALWEFTKASRRVDLSDDLASLQLPVLVITGDDDRIVPTAESTRLAGELPNAALVVIPASGHLPQEEMPREFIAAVTDFLRENTLIK